MHKVQVNIAKEIQKKARLFWPIMCVWVLLGVGDAEEVTKNYVEIILELSRKLERQVFFP